MPVSSRTNAAPESALRKRTALQSLLGVLLGLAASFSCGGGGGGGGGLSCPPSTGIECSSCQPGENLYVCAISSSNNTICARDDFTADQHCAALNSVVQSKTVCAVGTDSAEDGAQGSGGKGAEGADETAANGGPPPPPSDGPARAKK